jgi:uncharacterized membrane protein YecN with MAPEG domain
MTIPQWVLLGFAGWTLTVLSGTVGVYRLSNIVFRGSGFGEWRADDTQGSGWYRRAMRAHMNCVENLPVYAAIVLCATTAQATSLLMDVLALIVLGARVCQTTTHVSFEQTDRVAAIRFAFFLVQLLCMFVMGAFVAMSAAEYAAP